TRRHKQNSPLQMLLRQVDKGGHPHQEVPVTSAVKPMPRKWLARCSEIARAAYGCSRTQSSEWSGEDQGEIGASPAVQSTIGGPVPFRLPANPLGRDRARRLAGQTSRMPAVR